MEQTCNKTAWVAALLKFNSDSLGMLLRLQQQTFKWKGRFCSQNTNWA